MSRITSACILASTLLNAVPGNRNYKSETNKPKYMKWVKASERLPDNNGKYCVKEIDSSELSTLWYNKEKPGRCLLVQHRAKYLWLEDIPKNSGQVIWDKACHATLRSIAATFLNGENQKKAMLGSDKVVFQAIGETITKFLPPSFPPELDD